MNKGGVRNGGERTESSRREEGAGSCGAGWKGSGIGETPVFLPRRSRVLRKAPWDITSLNMCVNN